MVQMAQVCTPYGTIAAPFFSSNGANGSSLHLYGTIEVPLEVQMVQITLRTEQGRCNVNTSRGPYLSNGAECVQSAPLEGVAIVSVRGENWNIIN